MKEGRSLDVFLEVGEIISFLSSSIDVHLFIEHLLCVSHNVDNGATKTGKMF